jgi:hypothetical protein
MISRNSARASRAYSGGLSMGLVDGVDDIRLGVIGTQLTGVPGLTEVARPAVAPDTV